MTPAATPEQSRARLAEGSERLADWFAALGQWVTTHWLEVAIAVGVAALIFVLLSIVQHWAARYIARRDDLTGWRAILGRAVAQTGRFFRIMVAAELVAGYAQTPPALARVIHILFIVAVALQAAVWAREILLGLVERRTARETEGHDTLKTATTLIRVFVTFVVFAIAGIFVLDNLGVNVTGIVAGLGVGGIAIGLAAQGIFSDLFAAIAIIFDKPFRKGDTIEYAEGRQGTVENIGMKTTRLRAFTGEEVIIANAQLLEKDLKNITQRPHRRVKFTLGVIYQTPPDVCARIPAMLQAIVEEAGLVFVRSGFVAFNASSLDFELEFDSSADFAAMYDGRHRVGIAILQAFARDGIEIAYPTQTTFTAAPDGRMIMPYPQVQAVHAVDSTPDSRD